MMNAIVKEQQARARRVDAVGRAYAGSQRWIQHFVNREPRLLNEAILAAMPSLAALAPEIEWVSPLERQRYAEFRDDEFLTALGLDRLSAALRDFWPRRGPQWDALARLRWNGGEGVLLVEAKSYFGELYGAGCMASPRSRARIEAALARAKAWVGASETADWCGPLYQYANRLAQLYWMREVAQVQAWLAHICFVGDPRTPTSRSLWEAAINAAESELGLARPCPYAAAVLLNVDGERGASPRPASHRLRDLRRPSASLR
jgi:hypothetical protein